jgi:polyvinyl alcohol dehydrogenase (cytochrome)
MGFGGNLEGTGFQSAEQAGLGAADVPNLRLRWAFAFPGAVQVRTRPAVVGDVLLIGGQYGDVIALDALTGCVQWTFEADAGVRGAVLVGADAEGHALAYFVDFRTTAYALDVATGQVRWKTRVGRHPESSNTGSPALHDGRLIVPVSSMEVVTAQNPAYACCSGSGAVAALDAATGDVLWYHQVIPEDAREVGRNAAGTPVLAPSGAPVWSSPTIDTRRGLVYVGTGENYTRPATATSDAILAIDLRTGALEWSFQATREDAFTMACTTPRNRENCPAPPGPDLDFGMAPMLVTRPDGRQILVAGQKSGVVWALDPDAKGAVLWSTRVGKGSALGGIHWGMATDGQLAFAANADRDAVIVNVNPERALSPGLYALDLMSGDVVWSAPAHAEVCKGRQGCFAANSAAPTAIPGVVFAGGLDGHIRAHAAQDGRVLWDFDTAREFATANGVAGRGGAIDGPGPVVARGLLFMNSGYGAFGQMPGNLLLAFGVERR